MGLAGDGFDVLLFVVRHPTAGLNQQLWMRLLCRLCRLWAVAPHPQLPAMLRHHSTYAMQPSRHQGTAGVRRCRVVCYLDVQGCVRWWLGLTCSPGCRYTILGCCAGPSRCRVLSGGLLAAVRSRFGSSCKWTFTPGWVMMIQRCRRAGLYLK